MVSPIRVVLTQLESLCAWKMKEKESDSAAWQSELRLSPLTHFTDIAKVEPSLATPHCTRVHTLIKFQISSLQILSSFKIIWCHIPANFHCSLEIDRELLNFWCQVIPKFFETGQKQLLETYLSSTQVFYCVTRSRFRFQKWANNSSLAVITAFIQIFRCLGYFGKLAEFAEQFIFINDSLCLRLAAHIGFWIGPT